MDLRYLLIRKLETEKDRATSDTHQNQNKEEVMAIKDKLLDMIKNAEEQGGIETETLTTSLKEFSPGIINKEIQKLLEEGIVFEPRPGKIRWLG